MEELTNKITNNIKFGCASYAGVMLSVAIVAIRAFQPNAQPMESWSFFSWCLMLLPTIFPFFFWICIVLIWFVAYVIFEAFSKK